MGLMVGVFIRRNRVREMKHTGVKPDRGKVISIAIKNERGRFCSAYRLCQVHRPLPTEKLCR